MTIDHPSFETFLDMAEGRGVPRTVRSHLEHCAACRTEAERAEALVATMEHARTLDEVPQAARARAVEAVRAELARRREPVALVLRRFVERLGTEARILTAALAGDSLQASAATRAGAAPTAPRMLVYETAEHEITVSLARGDRSRTLDVSGQITPRTGELEPGGTAGLRVGSHEVTTDLSAFGEFTFESLPAGDIEIEVGVGSAVIRLAPIPRPMAE